MGVRTAPNGFYIALPFGDGTQWAQNVLAAGGCTLRWRGEDLALADPVMVGIDKAATAFPFSLRWMMRAAGVQQVIRLRPVDGPAGISRRGG